MPALSHRSGSRRRTISEINVVPYIDVMLVLLIIFMVTAPLITPSIVNLPTVGKAANPPARVIEVIITEDGQLRMRVDRNEPRRLSHKDLAARVKDAQQGVSDAPVVISADKAVRYEAVLKVMDVLQRAGVPRVGLAVAASAQP